jgi:hypothetical protein
MELFLNLLNYQIVFPAVFKFLVMGLKDLVFNFPYIFEVSFVILENDPTAFGAEALRNDELELIAEIKYGYIIGASADLELSKLRNKIAKIIREEYNSGKVADLWDVIDGINHQNTFFRQN